MTDHNEPNVHNEPNTPGNVADGPQTPPNAPDGTNTPDDVKTAQNGVHDAQQGGTDGDAKPTYDELAQELERVRGELDAFRASVNAEKRQGASDTLKKFIAGEMESYTNEQREYFTSQNDFTKFIGDDGKISNEAYDAIRDAIREFAVISPPGGGSERYADPSIGNGARYRPAPKGGTDYGRELFDRIKNESPQMGNVTRYASDGATKRRRKGFR